MPLVKRVLHLAHFGGQVGHGDDLVDELLVVVVTGDQQVQLTRLVLDQVEQLVEIDRMGEKKVENLLAGIEEAKGRGMARVLAGMGIRHVGDATAKALAFVAEMVK